MMAHFLNEAEKKEFEAISDIEIIEIEQTFYEIFIE